MILIFIILAILIYEILHWTYNDSNRNFDKIPGPKGLPIIGNIQDFFNTDENIWRLRRSRAQMYYPVYKEKVLNKRMVHLTDPADLEEVLKRSGKGSIYSSVKVWLGDGMLLTEGDIWRRSRKLVTKCFHFAVLSNYMNSFNGGVASLTKSLENDSVKPVDLNFLNSYTFRIVLATLFGNKPKITDEDVPFLKSLKTLTKVSIYKLILPFMDFIYKFTHLKKQEEEALKYYNGFTDRIIECNTPVNDDQWRLVNVLIKNLDGPSRKDEINTFIFAGQDTTCTALTFVLYALANKPNFQKEIYEEMTQICHNEEPTYGDINQMNLLDRFVKECLRLYPPASFIGRIFDEDISLPSGYIIPAGTSIFIDIFDVHRNPKIYPDPEKFDPDRFLPENIRERHSHSFVPFSAGPRNCIAQKYALLEIKTTICGILRKFHLKPEGSLEDIILIPDLLLKSKYPLKVSFITR